MTTADPESLAQAVQAPAAPRTRSHADNVLGPVLDVGRSGMRVGAGLGIALAAILHGYMVVRVYAALWGMESWIRSSRKEMHEFFYSVGSEIETKQKQNDPKPEVPKEVIQKPEEVKETEPVEKKVVEHKPQPTREVTQPKAKVYDDDPPGGGHDEIMVGTGTQSGDSASQGSGSGSGSGSGTGTGTGDGPGKGPPEPPKPPPPPPPPPPPDRSTTPTLIGSTSWNCPFPPEADAEGKDAAIVQLVVTVGPDGGAEKVSVMSDPGSGFGRAARSCALGRRYKAGLDRDGNPTRKTTAPITVRFSR